MDPSHPADNPAPVVYATTGAAGLRQPTIASTLPLPDDDATTREPIDAAEVFEHIRHLADPEHPYTLEQLGVVSAAACTVDDGAGTADVDFTPTVPHCSMATLIGLALAVRLRGALPRRFKVRVGIAPGAHADAEAVNKQLADKERVAAALENPGLRGMVAACLAGVGGGGAGGG